MGQRPVKDGSAKFTFKLDVLSFDEFSSKVGEGKMGGAATIFKSVGWLQRAQPSGLHFNPHRFMAGRLNSVRIPTRSVALFSADTMSGNAAGTQ